MLPRRDIPVRGTENGRKPWRTCACGFRTGAGCAGRAEGAREGRNWGRYCVFVLLLGAPTKTLRVGGGTHPLRPPSHPPHATSQPTHELCFVLLLSLRRAECTLVVSSSVMFFPPVSFGLVEEGLYRSALPNEINYPFLERLGLKTIIYLYPDDDIDAQL